MTDDLAGGSVTLIIKSQNSAQNVSIPGITWTANMNVQTAMERGYDKTKYDFALQYYGSTLGYLVLMVLGVYDAKSTYWMLYINGKLSPTGIDSTILNTGDVVELKYGTYTDKDHGDTIYSAKEAFFSK